MAHSIKLFLCLAALAMLSICIQAAPVNVSNDVAGHDGATDLVQQITLLPLDDMDQKTTVGAELARPSHDRAPLGRAVYSDLYYRRTSPARTSTGTGARAESSPLDKMAYLLSRLVLGGVLGVTEGWVLGFLSKRWMARRTIWRHYSSTSF